MLLFADTNLLVYAHDSAAGAKHARANEWVRYLWDSGTGRLSSQVLNECYVVLTRKILHPLAADEARMFVRDLRAWRPVDITADLAEVAWGIEDRFSISWWDSLIVAAAQSAQCGVLLTEDIQHGLDVDGLLVMDPFQTEINDIVSL